MQLHFIAEESSSIKLKYSQRHIIAIMHCIATIK